jgi:hypothetical protein
MELKGMGSMQQINQQKWSRMKRIIEELKKQPMSISDIEKLFDNKVGRRTLQNYMLELKALGLVAYDGQLYQWIESRQVYSKTDFELALRHSKLLVLSYQDKSQSMDDNDLLRQDAMDPFLAVDLIVFSDIETTAKLKDKCLYQHIRTGYPEMFALMEKYRGILDKLGYSKEPHMPKIGMFFEREWETIPKELKEAIELRNVLAGKLYFIVEQVKHGIPLKGFCDCCPRLHVSVQD